LGRGESEHHSRRVKQSTRRGGSLMSCGHVMMTHHLIDPTILTPPLPPFPSLGLDR
jgi:hypothetical protein